MRRFKGFFLIAVVACLPLFAQESAEHARGAEHSESAQHEDPLSVWKWANFLILAGVLGFALVKTLPPIFAARTREIQKGIVEAQQMKADAEKRAAEMDARMAALGAEVEKIRTQSKAEMQLEGERIRQETAGAVKKIQDQASLEVETAGKLARRELKQYAASLALDLAEQRIRGRMDANTEGALIDNFVNDLGRQGGKN